MASGSTFNIAAPAQYVSFAFWGWTDVYEVILTSCDGVDTGAGGGIDGAGCADSGGGDHVAAYSFNGNANDDAGVRSGIIYGATLAADRFGNADSAYYFGDQSRGDMITVPTPFMRGSAGRGVKGV
jgi:hypothetical protein